MRSLKSNVWRRPVLRYAGVAAALAALGVVAATCADSLTGPVGLQPNVTITYVGPPIPDASGRIQAIVGQQLKPVVDVAINGQPVTRASYVFSAPDTSVVAVTDGGEGLRVTGRGQDTVIVTLVGATIGKTDGKPVTDTVYISATADTNFVLPQADTLVALGETTILTAISQDAMGKRLDPATGTVDWFSSDPTVLRVNQTGVNQGDSTVAVVTALANSATPVDIITVFEGVDTVRTPLLVQQALARVAITSRFAATPALAPVGVPILLESLGDTVTVTATPLDSRGNVITGFTGTLRFAVTNPTRAPVDTASGLITAVDNTDATNADTVFISSVAQSLTQKVPVNVVQKAVTILIGSATHTDTIFSKGATLQMSAVARDARGNPTPTSGIAWSSANQSVAQVIPDVTPTTITARDIGTTTITATRNGVSDQITLVVRNDPASIDLVPNPASILAIDDTLIFTSITVKNAAGTPLNVKPTLSSANPAIVLVLNDSTLVGKALTTSGAVNVTASTTNGVTAIVPVTVTNYPTSMNIIDPTLTLASVGEQNGNFPVNFRNKLNAVLNRSSANWTSKNLAIVQIVADDSNSVLAVGKGSAWVVAVSPGNLAIRDSIQVVVTDAPATVTISPATPPTFTAFGSTATFTATVRNAAGNVISNSNVSWSVDAPGTSVTVDPSTGVVTAIANGTSTVRATAGPGGPSGIVNVTVAQAVSSSQSSVARTGANNITADGVAASTITVTLRDALGNGVAGKTVTLDDGGAPSSIGAASGPSNASGVVTFPVSSTTTGTFTYTATVTGPPSIVIAQTAQITFAPGTTSAALSTVVRTGANNVSANGAANSQITVTLRDAQGNVVPGKAVSLDDAGSSSLITAAGGTTSNTSGQVVFSVTNSVAETATYTATATDGVAIIITQTAQVSFVPGVTSAAQSTVTRTGANNVAADGTASQITVTLRDATGNAVAGKNVTLDDAGAPSTIGPSSGPSNASGVVTFPVSSTTTGTFTYTATATDGGAIVITATAQITFVAGAVSVLTTTITAAPTTIVADNLSTSAVAVQAKDASGNNLTSSGGVVALNTTLGTLSAVTNNNDGTYSATLTAGLAGGTATITGTIGGNAIADNAQVAIVVATHYLVTSATPTVPRRTSVIITAQLRDASNNNVPQAGKTVAWTSTTTDSAGSFATPTSLTNANGAAVVAFTVGGPAGTLHTVTAIDNTGLTGTSANITVSNPAPTLTNIAPISGNRLQTLDVVFTGSGYITGASSVNVGAGITVNSTTVDSPTQITANITVTAAAATGARNFSVTNSAPGGGTSGNRTFTVNNPAPTLASISPTAGDRLQTLDVVFTGTGYITGVTSVSVGAGITLNTTTVDSPTQITANITITAAAATGANDFSVTNSGPGGGTSGNRVFTVSNPPPTLTSIAPSSGDRLQTLDVVFTGTGYISGVSSVSVGAGITVNTTTVDSPTQITANITITAAAATGANNFSVTNSGPGGGTSGNQTFTVSNPVPTIATVVPGTVTSATLQLTTTITGTGFITGVTTVTFDEFDVVIAGTVTVDSANQITVTNIQYPPNIGPGNISRTLRVTNAGPGGGSVTQLITITP